MKDAAKLRKAVEMSCRKRASGVRTIAEVLKEGSESALKIGDNREET